MDDVELTSDTAHANLIWQRRHYKHLFNQLQPNQYINHFHNEGCLVTKGKLYAGLQAYYRALMAPEFPLEQFLQPSYRLYVETERDAFLQQLPAVDTEENLWIMKPSDLSKGIGIRVLWQLSAIKKQLQKNKGRFLVPGRGEKDYVIQKYIRNPLLLKGRKSEIRLYWLIANIEPLKVLLFDEGTVRLNSLPFQLGNYENQLIHVTNVYQQKRHPDYDPNVVLKWCFADLQQYLVEQNYTDNVNYIADILMPKFQKIISAVARSAAQELRDHQQAGQSFALYGADIILDDQLNPWLAEVQ
ncbi:MAG: hypothetical protein AAF512_10155, partial [Pseudomonadota bacterium]